MKLYRICAGIERDRNNEPLDAGNVEDILAALRRVAAKQFGGCNMVFGTGSYQMNAGSIVVEKSVVIEVYTTKATALAGFAKGLAMLLNAESVLVSSHECDTFTGVSQ